MAGGWGVGGVRLQEAVMPGREDRPTPADPTARASWPYRRKLHHTSPRAEVKNQGVSAPVAGWTDVSVDNLGVTPICF